MKKIILLSFLLIPLLSVGQKISYSFSLSYQQPYIAEVKENIPIQTSFPASTGYTYISTNYGIKEQYSSNSGGSVSGNFKYSFSSRIFIQSGLKLNLIRFKQQKEVISNSQSLGDIFAGDFNIYDADTSGLILFPTTPVDFGNIENQDKLGNTSILYTEIPIYFGYSIFDNKLTFKLGLTTSFAAYAQLYTYNFDDPNSSLAIVKDKTADGLSNLMFSGNIEVEYLVFKNIGLNISYLRSFSSIYDKDVSVGNPKYNIISIGLSYNILK